MDEEVKKNVMKFLHNNYDVMTYSLVDMEKVSQKVIEHRLNVKQEVSTVNQKKMNFTLGR